MDTVGRLGIAAEWRPRNGIARRAFGNVSRDYHAISGLDLFDYYQHDNVNTWNLVAVDPRNKKGADEYRAFLTDAAATISVMIGPSEVQGEIGYGDGFSAQSWMCDSANYVDLLSGSWGVYIERKQMYRSSDLGNPGRMMGPIGDVFRRAVYVFFIIREGEVSKGD